MQVELLEHAPLIDDAHHCAFTDLVAIPSGLLLAYRAASTHMSSDGVIRVRHSVDGRTWSPFAAPALGSGDLRDPKFCPLPDGRLLLVAATRTEVGKRVDVQTYRWIWDGNSWGEAAAVGDPDFWLWRVTWRDQGGFGWGYSTRTLDGTILYSTSDGTTFTRVGEVQKDRAYPNEHATTFLQDGSAVTLLRRDFGPRTALVGRSVAPFTDWTWKATDTRIGGPALITTESGELLACVRRMRDGMWRTVLCSLDPETPELTPLCTLPSGGDTSYAGMVLRGEELIVSYYSSHEADDGGTKVYVARCRVTPS